MDMKMNGPHGTVCCGGVPNSVTVKVTPNKQPSITMSKRPGTGAGNPVKMLQGAMVHRRSGGLRLP